MAGPNSDGENLERAHPGSLKIATDKKMRICYDDAFRDVFATLDELEAHFAARRFIVGERLTEADVRLFVTLIRFDLAYYGLFKCNLKRIADYPALNKYLRRMLEFPGIRETVNVDHIKRGYYTLGRSIRTASFLLGRIWGHSGWLKTSREK